MKQLEYLDLVKFLKEQDPHNLIKAILQIEGGLTSEDDALLEVLTEYAFDNPLKTNIIDKDLYSLIEHYKVSK